MKGRGFMKKIFWEQAWVGWAIIVVCLILAIIETHYLPEVWQSDSSMLLKNEMLFGTLGLWVMPFLGIDIIAKSEKAKDGDKPDPSA